MKLKVCGMKYPENVVDVAQLKPNYLGFIFFETSPRYMEETLSANNLKQLPISIKKVGVFVNESEDKITEAVKKFGLDALQLHGDEPPELCERLRGLNTEIIKVFRVGETFNFSELEPYLYVVDFFLFDTKGKNYGGNGVAFNWGILQNYPYNIPFFLSGGIRLGDVEKLKKVDLPQLYALDVNSGFENTPGNKNITLLQQFISEL